MANEALHDSALGSINAHKKIWNRADLKYQTFKSELERLDSNEEQNTFEAKKTANKIQILKDRIANEKMLKENSKAEISILEKQTWKKDLTDPGEESVSNLRAVPDQKESEQLNPARFKKKRLFA